MSKGRLLVVAIASFVFPGFGQGLVSRRWMVVWAAANIVAVLLILVSIWFVFPPLLVRLGAAIDAVVRVHRAANRRPTNLPAAGLGDAPTPVRWNRTLPAIAVVIGALGLGVARLAVEGFKLPTSSMAPTLEIGDHVFADKLSVRWRPPARGEVIVFRHPCMPDRKYVKRVVAIGGDTVEIRCSVVYINGAAVPSQLVDAACTYQDQRDGGDRVQQPCSRYREQLGGHGYEVFHDAERPQRDADPDRDSRDFGDSSDFPHGEAPSCAQQLDREGRPAANQAVGELVVVKAAAAPCEPQRHFVVPAGSLFTLGDNRRNSNDSRYWGVVPDDNVIGRITGIWLPVERIGSIE